MTRKNKKFSEGDLEQMFQKAREHVPHVSDDLMGAILRDAAQALPAEAPAKTIKAKPVRAGWSTRMLKALGGWQSVTAMAACACIGLLLGYMSPDSSSLLRGELSAAEDFSGLDYTLYSDIDDLLTEG
jgi:hypothetical protein